MDQAVEQQPRLIQITPPGYQEAWEMVLSQLRMEMSQANYDSYAKALQPLSFTEGVFRLGAINSYTRDWADSRLRHKIAGLLEGVLNQRVTVHFNLISAGSVRDNSSVRESSSGRDNSSVLASTAALPDVIEAPAAPVESPVDSESERGSATGGRGPKKKPAKPDNGDAGSPRKIQLQRAYGTERARVIQPERGMFLTMYFFNNWLPLLGHSAMTTVIAARSLCYWNPMTGELRNVVETDMTELAQRASVSVRTVKDVLNNELVKKYFLRYKVRRVMTPNGVRTAGIILQVRMDDPLTPEDQDQHKLAEEEHWYTADFDEEEE